MSHRQAEDRVFHWLIGAILLSVPVGTIVHGLYPATTGRIWLDFMGAVGDATTWILQSNVFWVAVLLFLAFCAFGLVLIVVNGIRSLIA